MFNFLTLEFIYLTMSRPVGTLFFLIRKYLTFCISLISFITFGQEEPKAQLKLFLDCSCEKSYIRQEINFVSHVRDQAQANVQLFIYDIANGSGGRTYNLDFKGLDDYLFSNDQ